MVPLLEIPPVNVETGFLPNVDGNARPGVVLFARIVPLLTMPPEKRDTDYRQKCPEFPPAAREDARIDDAAAEGGRIADVKAGDAAQYGALRIDHDAAGDGAVILEAAGKGAVDQRESARRDRAGVADGGLMVEFVKVSSGRVPALVQPATVTLL